MLDQGWINQSQTVFKGGLAFYRLIHLQITTDVKKPRLELEYVKPPTTFIL
jgi:hypothetical protein